MPSSLKKSLLIAGCCLGLIIALGTGGYYLLGLVAGISPGWRLVDCLYMTVITLTTVGFGEIIEVAAVPGARLFTIFYLMCGLGVSAYFISTLTAFLVEGELNNLFWRAKMKKEIAGLSGHIILCGSGRVGRYILKELLLTGWQPVLIEQHEERILELQAEFGDFAALVGDATHEKFLMGAGLERAAGVISALGDDKDNLCVVVSCRQLNPRLHIISRCSDSEFGGKLKLVGAEVVIPNFIGGLRMASQMIRPRVVHYLDTMLRDTGCPVRIEEVTIPATSHLAGLEISAIDLQRYGNLLLLAVLESGRAMPLYNPPPSHVIKAGDVLVFQAFPDALASFRKEYA